MGSDDIVEVLAARFERHANEEGKVLDAYRALSEKLADDALGNLVSHILTEEELHHLLLRTMAKWLRERPYLAPAREATPERAELLRLTRQLRAHEKEAIDGCRELEARVPEEGGAVIRALLEAMALDSEKHHHLLGAVEAMLEG
ncbi:MAG: hypothetical protein IPK07_00855 [Deltaproteobacteria bacterium]|nr:hypothetical protein [Deltaproteobacteria bacterium]